MDYDFSFGKSHAKRKHKLSKKMLDSMSLKKLKLLAKKHKVSCYKKGTRVCVKKSTLLKRLKKSRSINKILVAAEKMKKGKSRRSPRKTRKSPRRTRRSPKRKVRRNRFGLPVGPNQPALSYPLEKSVGQTYDYQKEHYLHTPSSLISYNFPKNFAYKQGALGRSSLPAYYDYISPRMKKHSHSPSHKFGRYFQ